MSVPPAPPDQPARDRILADLDTTLLVEAAAGTGKTTSLAGRMVALVRTGRCEVDTLAAVTFTRKAAAELRARFTGELARAARSAAGAERARLAAALDREERCFVGTIHAFCARLLRERPIEAGVDVAFTEIEEGEDAALRAAAWEAFVARLYAAGDPRLDRLARLGLGVGALKTAFLDFARYPDVEEWPAPEVEPGDLAPVRTRLDTYLARMRALIPSFPEERGSDKLMDRYERISRFAANRDLARDEVLMEVLERFTASPGGTQKCWADKALGKAECDRWREFAEQVARPALARWREARYAAAVPLLHGAREEYDRLRRERGALNFQDLLGCAARLLRDRPKVREYFRRRFTHLLVDEFQDTDPLQAEVVLFLTAADPAETDWRRCRPRPGSLFVVGDPKQSIYRFRRADIATYNRVKEIIGGPAGENVVPLDANFRTLPAVIDWVNRVFAGSGGLFPGEASDHSPAAHRLASGRIEAGERLDATGVATLDLPGECGRGAADVEEHARRVAAFIRGALDAGSAAAGDFLVVTWKKKRLATYAAELQRLGIPNRVTGGSAWGRVGELALLAGCLRAIVEPENPVALVACLRGGLFGLSDAELYAFKRAGGRFSWRSPLPAGLDEAAAGRFARAFGLLARGAELLRRSPPVAALARIADDLGLLLGALASPGGDVRAGSIGKAFAVLREAAGELTSVAELAAHLEALIAEEAEFDGIPARADEGSFVRVMNLHKVKGLEAPVVVLAEPAGRSPVKAGVHIDRAGGRTLGYLRVTEPYGKQGTRVLAQPPGWEGREEVEKRFLDAERNRLLYVAATRARDLLVLPRCEGGTRWNPWADFAPWSAELPALPDPGAPRAPAEEAVAVGEEEVAGAAGAIAARWAASGRPTYAVRGAREVAIGAAELHRPPAGGEHGTEWGTVIHFLLETALREPGRDLADLARSALEEQELPADRLEEALATVAAVRGSALWRRASSSAAALVEVPFGIRLEPGLAESLAPPAGRGQGEGLPLLVRGVIDLAFREADGWVIADWKTDRGAAHDPAPLVERYRPQVALYAEVWRRITGESVKETGLFFTATGTYARL